MISIKSEQEIEKMRVAGKIIRQKPYCYKFNKKSTNYALNILSAMTTLFVNNIQ